MEDSKCGTSWERQSSAASGVQTQRKEVNKGNAKRRRSEWKESSEILGKDPEQSDSMSILLSSLKKKHIGQPVVLKCPPHEDGNISIPRLPNTSQRKHAVPHFSETLVESPTSAAKYFFGTEVIVNGCNQKHRHGSLVNKQLPSSLQKTSLLSPELSLLCPSNTFSCSKGHIRHEPAPGDRVTFQEQNKATCMDERTSKVMKSELPIMNTNNAENKSSTPFVTKCLGPHFTIKDVENRLRDVHAEKILSAPELPARTNSPGTPVVTGTNKINVQRTPEILKQYISEMKSTISFIHTLDKMAPSQHVVVEVANFLCKLIQEFKDEPVNHASKLYMISEHMKMIRKEQSLPYQMISREMETVISQHRLDIEVLKSSILSFSSGLQGVVACQRITGGNPRVGDYVTKKQTEAGRSNAPKAELLRNGFAHRVPQNQAPKIGKSLEHESSSNRPMEDPRCEISQERQNSAVPGMQTRIKEASEGNSKRKRPESKEPFEILVKDPQQSDSASTAFCSLKGKHSGSAVVLTFSLYKGGKIAIPRFPKAIQREQGIGIRRKFKDIGERVSRSIPIPNAENIMKDVGEAGTSQPSASRMPFKEHHLQQQRAQSLEFHTLRNNVPLRKPHLETSLGEIYLKEDGNHQRPMKDRQRSMPSLERCHNPKNPGFPWYKL
ncbi:uncharacterized protein LOC144705572 isoform X2 [Wolffia australiana]